VTIWGSFIDDVAAADVDVAAGSLQKSLGGDLGEREAECAFVAVCYRHFRKRNSGERGDKKNRFGTGGSQNFF